MLAGLWAAPAWAQDEAGEEEGPKVQTIQMIERGIYLEADFGVTGFVATLADDGDERSFGAATQVGVFAGYDVLPILSLGLGVRALATGVSGYLPVPAGSDVDPGALGVDPTRVEGDIYYLAPMLTARFAVLTTDRNFVWVRADAGFAIGFPGDIGGVDYGGNGPIVSALVGYERFTKLRHFSVGASLGATIVTAPAVGIGISFLPHVKYTF